MIIVAVTSVPTPAEVPRTERQAYIHGLTNGTRATRDLGRLDYSSHLSGCAEEHARLMAATGVVDHSVCPRRFEAVGAGPSLQAAFRSFWRSRWHRPVLLCDCARVGIGVERARGLVYVVIDAV